MFNLPRIYPKGMDVEEKHLQKITIMEWYRARTKIYLAILEAVYGQMPFVIPETYLNLVYVRTVKELKELQKHEYFQELPFFDFDDYPALTANEDRKSKEYPDKRKRTLSYLEHIEQLFIDECKVEGNLPESWEKDLQDDYDLIQRHKEKLLTSSQPPIGRPITLQFTKKKNNTKKKVFDYLNSHIGEWVHKKDIKKYADVKNDDDFRSYISQLRDDIDKQNPLSTSGIENDDNGKYKLIKSDLDTTV